MARTSATKRLYNVMQKFAETRRQGDGTPFRVALGSALGMDPNDAVSLHRAYLGVIRLAEQAHAEVLAAYVHPTAPEEEQAEQASAAAPIAAIRDALLANSIHSQVVALTQFPLNDLRILAIGVTNQSVEDELTDEALAGARAAVDEALNIILESSLTPEFKAAFAAQIREVRAAIDNYQIFGPEGVTQAVSVVLTRAVTVQGRLGPDEATAVNDAVAKMANVLTIIHTSFAIGQQIVGPALGLLLGGGR